MKNYQPIAPLFLLLTFVVLQGCSSLTPPDKIDDGCTVDKDGAELCSQIVIDQ